MLSVPAVYQVFPDTCFVENVLWRMFSADMQQYNNVMKWKKYSKAYTRYQLELFTRFRFNFKLLTAVESW